MHKIKYMGTKIWEFSLYFPRELLIYFEKLKKQLKQILNVYPNCVSISISDDMYCFLIALSKEAYSKNILFIKDKIIEIILIYYKPKTLISQIENFDIKNHDNIILLDILSNFDQEEDKKEIFNHLSLCEKLYLSSFVNFKLKSLKKRWIETAELINQNNLFLNENGIKKELIQFLMEGLESKVEYVKLTQNGIKLNNNVIENISLFYSLYDYDNTLFTLINIFPKKIEIENYKSFDISLIQNLHNLFGDKLILKD